MRQMRRSFEALHEDEEGAAMTEYAGLLALIMLATVAVVGVLGETIAGVYQSIVDELTAL